MWDKRVSNSNNVLLSFLTKPMGKIVRLSNRSQPLRIGCMDNLYGSVENLDLQLFRTAECRDMLLHPRSRAEDLLMNLKLKYDQFEPSRYFKCSNESCRSPTQSYSYYETVCCWYKGMMNVEITFKRKETEGGGIFVKGPARFIISDDLQVLPPFTSAISSLVGLNGFADWNTVEELTFDVGADEVLNVLMCPLVSKTPLSDTLLKDKTVPNVSIEYLDRRNTH
ncbi:uncharacterized protein LOC103929848 [Pyrus x bretschneideri]|uniref:uncharacterized protein LOC103929848 n=1 Tax=Pyrus x bretschneideri TaxID=225117 RepID=UPI0020304DE7|nr:uncharacterized protein LOC103929848 [Pyrus x bretschneideri]